MIDRRALCGERSSHQLGLERFASGQELAGDAGDPRLMLLFDRTKRALVNDLHRLLASGERQADDTQGVLALRKVGGHQ